MYASFLMKNKYSKVAGKFYYLISAMKVHFAARGIAQNWLFKAGYIKINLKHYFETKVPPINPLWWKQCDNYIYLP